jgi:hypothetical protein
MKICQILAVSISELHTHIVGGTAHYGCTAYITYKEDGQRKEKAFNTVGDLRSSFISSCPFNKIELHQRMMKVIEFDVNKEKWSELHIPLSKTA